MADGGEGLPDGGGDVIAAIRQTLDAVGHRTGLPANAAALALGVPQS